MIDRSLRAHRLHKQEQFGQIATLGKKVSAGLLSFKHIPSPDGSVRLAFIIRKKCGNAVFRNRVRRILRHEFYDRLDQVVEPIWGSLIYYGQESTFKTPDLHSDADRLLDRLGWRS